MPWKKFKWGNCVANAPSILSANWDEEAIEDAGFDPEDPEVVIGRISDHWEIGQVTYLAGTRIVSELTCEGHGFALEYVEDED